MLMAILVGLGLWIAMGPGSTPNFPIDRDATTSKVLIGETRGVLEVVRNAKDKSTELSFRLWLSDGPAVPPTISRAEAESILGPTIVNRCLNGRGWVFRFFQVTTWSSLVWIGIGFFGQFLFSGRMLLQWIISEKKERSVVTESFWWFSLVGGVTLFCYFVWRQDPVPMIGQASGIVIYARNIHLIRRHAKSLDPKGRPLLTTAECPGHGQGAA